MIGKTTTHFSTTVNVGIFGCYSRKLRMLRNTENLKNFISKIVIAIKK